MTVYGPDTPAWKDLDLTAVPLVRLGGKIILVNHQYKTKIKIFVDVNRPFPHSASVRTNNSSGARLGWPFSYICCIFVHPDFDSVPLFVGMRSNSRFFFLSALLTSRPGTVCFETL